MPLLPVILGIVKGSAMETKALKKQMGAAIAMVLVAAIALGAATFAWFVNNTKVTAESANVTATTANTLLISEANADKWMTLLPLNADLENVVPVSTVGSNGTALTFVKDSEWETDSADNMSYASEFSNATSGTDYYETSFDLKGSVSGSKLYLDSETSLDTEGTNKDMLKAMRLGLVVDGKTYIYQLNGEHLASSYATSIDSAAAVDGISDAINSAGQKATMTINNKSNTVGVLPLATAPASANEFVTTSGDADLLYTFKSSGDVVNVKAYVWMEGCDYDCNSAVVAGITGQKLIAKLGFAVAEA